MLVLDVLVLGPRVLLVRGADLSWLSSYGVAKFFGDQVGPLVRKFDTSCLSWVGIPCGGSPLFTAGRCWAPVLKLHEVSLRRGSIPDGDTHAESSVPVTKF